MDVWTGLDKAVKAWLKKISKLPENFQEKYKMMCKLLENV